MHFKTCPCCSEINFENCCVPFINGSQFPTTAEQLMRSRYTAYTLANTDYILKTTHPTTRNQYSAKSIQEWAKSSSWLKLEIKATTENTVSFYAYYSDEKGKAQIHREHSHFEKMNDRWYFVEGNELD